MKNFRQHITLGLAATAAVTLVACGGGGSSGANGSIQPSILNGLAATGLAIDNGTVSLKCIGGAVNPVRTKADGTFVVDVSQVTLPCVARVDYQDSTGTARKLHSLARTAGTLNITQVTDMVVANLSSTGVAVDVFDQFESKHTEVEGYNDARVRTATDTTKTLLESKGISTASLNNDVIGTPFVAKHGTQDGDAQDHVLDQIGANIQTAKTSLDAWEKEIHDGHESNLSTTTGQIGNATAGKAAWNASCSGCHGAQVSDAKNAANILDAIGKNKGGMGSLASVVTQTMANNIATYMVYGVSSTPTAALTSQAIIFTTPGNQTLGVTPAALSASATSGLAVTIASTTPTVCSVTGTSLALNTAGTCTLTASQAGNATYSKAPSVSYSFTVASANGVILPTQAISFTNPGTQTLGVTPAALVASSDSGLSVALATTTPSVCSVSGNTLTLVAAGTCTVTANQAGNTGYVAAPTVSLSFTVTSPTPVTPVASAVAGKALFASNSCGMCHGTPPANLKVLNGANRPAVIRSAINSVGAMASYSGLTDQNLADIAAYLATPAI